MYVYVSVEETSFMRTAGWYVNVPTLNGKAIISIPLRARNPRETCCAVIRPIRF